MKHKAIRILLAVIEAIIGLGAIGGGIAILTGVFDQWLPLAWLQGTPFSDYTIGVNPFSRTLKEVNFRFNQARASVPRHSQMSSQVARASQCA